MSYIDNNGWFVQLRIKELLEECRDVIDQFSNDCLTHQHDDLIKRLDRELSNIDYLEVPRRSIWDWFK